jgi:pyridoxal phosphate enzyme (YggS family)
MIETIDSLRIAEAVNSRCAAIGKIMPALVEVNSGWESNKTGVPPDEVISLVRQVAELPHIKIQGLMTMGPRFGNPEEARPYFRLTKKLFDQLVAENVPHSEMRYLSMGMSNSYIQAIEEGANIVRIGTKLFGTRNKD